MYNSLIDSFFWYLKHHRSLKTTQKPIGTTYLVKKRMKKKRMVYLVLPEKNPWFFANPEHKSLYQREYALKAQNARLNGIVAATTFRAFIYIRRRTVPKSLLLLLNFLGWEQTKVYHWLCFYTPHRQSRAKRIMVWCFLVAFFYNTY